MCDVSHEFDWMLLIWVAGFVESDWPHMNFVVNHQEVLRSTKSAVRLVDFKGYFGLSYQTCFLHPLPFHQNQNLQIKCVFMIPSFMHGVLMVKY